MALKIVYENNSVIVVSKLAGRLVIPGRGEFGEPLSAEVSRHTGRKIYVVHRIDRQASGLVLFAKDPDSHRRLCGEFESRAVSKLYLAAVLGRLYGGGTIDVPIKPFGSGRMGAAQTGGKPSLTRYRVLESYRNATLLEVEPQTGRRHQIRAHLYHLGHPILGDTLYGRQRPIGGAPRLMLHALELACPTLGKTPIRAEPDEDFLEVLEGLKAAS